MVERKRIGLRDLRTLEPDGVLWDSAVPGLAARRRAGDSISFCLKYRTADGRQRWHTIGRAGAPWTPDTAPDEARRLLGQVASGADPATDKKARRNTVTVSDLCDAYMADAQAGRLLTRRGVGKKPATLDTDGSRISAHIKPLLGAMKVPAVTRGDVERFMHAVAAGSTSRRVAIGKRGGQGAASRTVGLLGANFTYAERQRLRSDNPVRGVMRFADGQRDRRLDAREYGQLGQGLLRAANPPDDTAPRRKGARKPSAVWPHALALTRFLALTGWRSGEALGLRWGTVDLHRRVARLPDTKTGLSIRVLSHAACAVLHVQGPGQAEALVFPATRGEGVMSGFPSVFARVAGQGGLGADVTPHVLRHSFASVAGDLGYSELTIAALVGHKGHSITSRYVHAADTVLLAAADAVAAHVSGLLDEPSPG